MSISYRGEGHVADRSRRRIVGFSGESAATDLAGLQLAHIERWVSAKVGRPGLRATRPALASTGRAESRGQRGMLMQHVHKNRLYS